MMKKIISFLLIAVLGIGILAGCASSEPKVEGEIPPSIPQEQPQEEPFLKVEGIYVGQMDSNSIEVMVNGEPKAFRIEEIKEEFPALEENDEVEIKYIENEHGQLIVKEILKK